jgi:hypothetical protein
MSSLSETAANCFALLERGADRIVDIRKLALTPSDRAKLIAAESIRKVLPVAVPQIRNVESGPGRYFSPAVADGRISAAVAEYLAIQMPANGTRKRISAKHGVPHSTFVYYLQRARLPAAQAL